MTGWTTGWT